MIILRNICIPFVALLLYASAAPADDAEPPRHYDIELLIFQNLVENDAGEVWPLDYSTWYEEAAEPPAADGATPPDVTWLPESSFHLTAERNALARSSAYRPLTYLAWRQTVVDRDQARPIQIPVSGDRSAAHVDGTVKVAVERYLHLYLDLQLHLPGSPALAGDNTANAEVPEIRLTEQRRMRSKEIHYFDNPRFGVIALITPYEPQPGKRDGATTTQTTAPPAGSESAPVTTP